MLMNNVNWDKAKGSKVKINGRWYIDFTSSIFTQNFGHNNPYVIKEVKKQLSKCSHAYGYNTEIKEKYLEELKKFTRYKNILLFSTGAEAIEATIKIALNNDYYTCVGIKGAMHGRTLGAESLVGKRETFYIQTKDSISDIDDNISNCAIFIEGYRGYDCKQIPNQDILTLKKLQENNNIIIFDEIQSGFYRTGMCFIKDFYGIKPDILVIGKSMGGGFPLSAVCWWNKPFNLEGIELTSTHSGQPIQMAAGYGVLKYIQDKLNKDEYYRNIEMMNQFFNSLRTEHNNLGMVGAFKCYQEDLIYKVLFNSGLLVTKTDKGWIKIAPPVNIDSILLEKGLNILRRFVK